MDYRDKLKHSVNSKALALIVLGILVLLNILSLRYFFRFDWTQNKQYSISDSTVSILHDLDDLVTVKAYFSDDLPPQALPIRQYVQDLLSEYKAYGSGHFDYEFVDPSTNSDVAQEASGLGVQEIRMQVVENDSLQVKNGYMGIGLFFGGNTEGIPVLQAEELGNLEYDLTSRILKMSQPREMVVAFLSGHGEHEIGTGVPFVDQGKDVDYAIAGQQMRANYAVRTLDFSAGDTLEGVDVLVVAGPKRDLSDRDIFEIDQYLLQGGKAVFLIDGIDQIEGSADLIPRQNNLNSLFASLGIQVDSNLLLDERNEMANFSQGPGSFFIVPYPPFIRIENFTAHPIVNKIPSFVGRFISSLSIQESDSLQYDQFVKTSPQSWYQSGSFQANPQSIPPAAPDTTGPQTFAVSITGLFSPLKSFDRVPVLQKYQEDPDTAEYTLEPVTDDPNRQRDIITEAQAEASLIVFADSDFASDASAQGDQAGLVVFLNSVDYLVFGDELISIRSKILSGRNMEDLDAGTKSLMKFLGILLIPLMISFWGVLHIWLRRKEEKLLKL